MSKAGKPTVRAGLDRRSLFSAAAAGSVAALAGAAAPKRASAAEAAVAAPPPRPAVAAPSAAALEAEHGEPVAPPGRIGRTASDQMVDTLRHLNIDYISTMAGSSFRGLHESLINYGGNTRPEILTCLHEEISVAFAHGYAKVAGKPMACMVHGVVGVQHASMAIYNAWADKVPIVLIAGNTLDGTQRRAGAEWQHSAIDNAVIVRDFLKWDAQPLSALDFTESCLRAYGVAVTPPAGPVMIVVDSELQEHPIGEAKLALPPYRAPTPPAGDTAALDEAAKLIVEAANPVIVADRLARTPAGMERLVQLAELLQAPVVDRGGRQNIPTTHPLCQTDRARNLIGQADVILGLELNDPWSTVNQMVDRVPRTPRRTARADVKLIDLGSGDLSIRANFADHQRYQGAHLQISGDGEASLPYLIEQVRRLVNVGDPARHARRASMEQAHKAVRERALVDAAYGWDASPITTGRLCWEIYQQVKDLDWALVGGDYGFKGNWPHKLWPVEKHHQFTGSSGAAGIGYCAPAAVGAALAHREHGRFCINIQGDGDLMVGPGSLWTAAHHKIPLLTVMHNNRAYHQEVMHLQKVAGRHSRGVGTSHIGTTIDNPAINYGKMAESMGVWGAGTITDPADLAPTLKRAVEVVKSGQPALVDVFCQGR